SPRDPGARPPTWRLSSLVALNLGGDARGRARKMRLHSHYSTNAGHLHIRISAGRIDHYLNSRADRRLRIGIEKQPRWADVAQQTDVLASISANRQRQHGESASLPAACPEPA